MLKLELFDANKTYTFPNGAIASPEVIATQFPSVMLFPYVIEVNGNVCQAVMELAALRSMHGIDEGLTNAEAIAALEVIINTAPPDPGPSAEERIAAALEFQNLMAL